MQGKGNALTSKKERGGPNTSINKQNKKIHSCTEYSLSYSLSNSLNESKKMSSDNLFHSAVDAVFQNWPALQFAVDQGAAGPQSANIAKWMVSVTVQWFSENKNLEYEEVEDFLADIVNQEFNDVFIDDGSVTETSKLVCDFYRLCSLSKENCRLEINRFLQAVTDCDLSKCKVDKRAEILADIDEEENIEQITAATNDMNINEQPKPEEQDLDGWTMVKPRKKK